MVFGPSLTELFYEAGMGEKLIAVDRHSTWPAETAELPVAGDFLSPSLETIAELGATSIHVAGTSNTLKALGDQLGIPVYSYSFDTLEDVMDSARRIEALYEDADLSAFSESVRGALDSLSEALASDSLTVMVVIYIEEDGAITLAGQGTFFAQIIEYSGCILIAPDTGSYPAVSVEGILSMKPERVLILAPDSDPERILRVWTSNGLSSEGVFVLNGDYLLIPGSRLPKTIREIGSCLS